MAMVEVSVYGSENPSAFSKLTGEICKILEDVLGIAPDHVYVNIRRLQTGAGTAAISNYKRTNKGAFD